MLAIRILDHICNVIKSYFQRYLEEELHLKERAFLPERVSGYLRPTKRKVGLSESDANHYT